MNAIVLAFFKMNLLFPWKIFEKKNDSFFTDTLAYLVSYMITSRLKTDITTQVRI